MRAIVANDIGPPEDLTIVELPDPAPGPGEVLVDIRAAAVNFPDLLVIEGKYQVIPPHPFVPGKEGAGVVAAIGEGVDGLSPGDRVMVQAEWGTYARKLVVAADHCFPMPDGMGFDEAAAIGIAYQTAHFALVARAGQAGRPGAGHRGDRQCRHRRDAARQGVRLHRARRRHHDVEVGVARENGGRSHRRSHGRRLARFDPKTGEGGLRRGRRGRRDRRR